MKLIKKMLVCILFTLCMTICIPNVMPQLASTVSVDAAKLNSKKVVLIKGKGTTLKLKGAKGKVKWSTSNAKIATVNAKGKVTAKSVGKATIAATNKGKKYTCTVVVEAPKLSASSLSIIKGKKATLKMIGTTQKVTWKSSNKKIATVTSKGVITAKKTGTATISAKVGGKTYKCKVTVKNAPVSKPTVKFETSATKVTLNESGSKKVNITAVNTGTIRWNITDTSIVSCEWDEKWNGNVIGLTITGKKAGKTTVTITNAANSQKLVITVTVKAPEFKVGTDSITLKEDGVQNVDITYAGTGSLYYDIEDTDIVSCEWTRKWNGDTTALKITGKDAGTTTVKITNSLNDEVLTINVTVQCPAIIKMPVVPKLIANYNYKGQLDKMFYVRDIKCEVRKSGSEYYYKISYSGEKEFDLDGNYISSSCELGYKIYKDGMVVESGTDYTTAVCVGEKFGGCYFSGYLDEPGEYELVLLDIR